MLKKIQAKKRQLFSLFTNPVQRRDATLIYQLPKSVGPTLSRFQLVSQQAKAQNGDSYDY